MPTVPGPETSQRIGLCVDCNYPLQGLAKPRCPECGRRFNPNDPLTMNLGRAIGPRARWLLQPIGRPTVIAALLALLALLVVTRLPLGAPSLAAARYWLQPRLWRTRESLVTWRDWTYAIGLVLGIAAMAALVVRTSLRTVVLILWRQDRRRAGIRRVRMGAAVGAILCAWAAVLTGWPVQVGQHWIICQIAQPPVTPTGIPRRLACPVPLRPEQELAALRAAAIALPSARQRVWAIKMDVERQGVASLPTLMDALRREKDGAVRAMELRLIAISRDEANTGLFAKYLADPDPQARAAAIDGLGMVYALAYPLPNPGTRRASSMLASDPPIELGPLLPDEGGLHEGALPESQRALPPEIRETFRQKMLTGSTADEREAAARALLPWPPPGYRLRVAEWGVWISNGGDLKLIQSVLDEIPPFVHRTGNALPEFDDRISRIRVVTKPIVHFTANEAIPIDMAVVIRAGRPYYAYPLPDDFAVSLEEFWTPPLISALPAAPADARPLDHLEDSSIAPLQNVREGYPWVTPRHGRSGASIRGSGGDGVAGLGLRWQSLIVSPERLPWMMPPAAPPDPRYAWWDRLRQVPTSWVSSRGESDRFVYYDGPTLAKTPVDVTLKDTVLEFDPRSLPARGWLPTVQRRKSEIYAQEIGSVLDPPPDPPPHHGLFIRVAGGKVTGQQAETASTVSKFALSRSSPLRGPEVKAKFEQMLKDAGLTAPEAAGLAACWSPQFFEKDGQRFLLLLTAEDYDALCPMTVRPPPSGRGWGSC
jgi:hypothetical protein